VKNGEVADRPQFRFWGPCSPPSSADQPGVSGEHWASLDYARHVAGIDRPKRDWLEGLARVAQTAGLVEQHRDTARGYEVAAANRGFPFLW